MYKVTAAIDSLDPNPVVLSFDLYDEAVDFIYDEIERRVQWRVDHSPYSISEEELEQMREEELCLITLQEE